MKSDNIKIMIIGLGSVGIYLLDYLISKNDPAISIVVAGRDAEKMQTKVNISKVAGLIRGFNKSNIEVEGGIALNNIDAIQKVIEKYPIDFIVNSNRVYLEFKYESISWKNLRAYGICSPLAVRFTKNVIEACDKDGTDAVAINTSYIVNMKPVFAE